MYIKTGSWLEESSLLNVTYCKVNTENVSFSQRIAGPGGRDGPGHRHVLSLPAD